MRSASSAICGGGPPHPQRGLEITRFQLGSHTSIFQHIATEGWKDLVDFCATLGMRIHPDIQRGKQ